MADKINSYELSRSWFNWCFDNPDLISPNHSALYFFAIEHCNRLGWKSKFGLPTTMAKEAIGIKSYNTYIKTLTDLVEWGFIKIIEKSKNQYSSNIIALSKNNKAPNKSLDKAFIKHVTKQSESTIQSTCESISSINKPSNNKPSNQEQIYRIFKHLSLSISDFEKLISEGWNKEQIDSVLDSIENYAQNKKYTNLLYTCRNWLKKDHKPNAVQKKLSALEIVLKNNENEANNTGS